MEIDLDQTALLLCQEMQAGADRNVTICQLQAHLAWEREHHILAMAAMSTLTAQLRLKDQELLTQADEHSNTKVQIIPFACSCNANKVLQRKQGQLPVAQFSLSFNSSLDGI